MSESVVAIERSYFRRGSRELQQSHGHAELDRYDAGDENYGGKNCCELD
jgi:hypothetical protein